jgi:hypothetical protein
MGDFLSSNQIDPLTKKRGPSIPKPNPIFSSVIQIQFKIDSNSRCAHNLSMVCPLLVHCLIRGPAQEDWAPQLHNEWTVVN